MDNNLAPTPWIAVNTHPHRERSALENLRRQEFEPYCPVIRRRRSHARRIDLVLRPLFPSYLFVRARWDKRSWRPILSTYGVRNIVRAGERPSFLEHEFIANLKAREIDGAIVRPPTPYEVGQKVKVSTLHDLVATIIEMNEKDRIVVLLEIMQGYRRVEVGSDSLTPA
jgi:transcriptional antiterminator RfaH